jgi:hypothetical protein
LGEEFRWWKYLKGPVPKFEEYEQIKKQSEKTAKLNPVKAINTTF